VEAYFRCSRGKIAQQFVLDHSTIVKAHRAGMVRDGEAGAAKTDKMKNSMW
jgi:hypothetical protein